MRLTCLAERLTRHTLRFFGSLMLVGLVLLAMQWLGVVGGVGRFPAGSRRGKCLRLTARSWTRRTVTASASG